MTALHFGIQSRRMASAADSHPPAYGARNTSADSNSSYRLPSQSILHREDVPDSPLDVGAGSFVSLFLVIIAGAFIGLYFFLRAIGL